MTFTSVFIPIRPVHLPVLYPRYKGVPPEPEAQGDRKGGSTGIGLLFAELRFVFCEESVTFL